MGLLTCRPGVAGFSRGEMIVIFSNQQEYERYYSPEERQKRLEAARKATETAVSEALALFNAGDLEGARQRLFDAGISDDGIAAYLSMWRN